jgi:hypothetical protein
MDRELAAVAETLAFEFDDLQCMSVVRVLTSCAEESPNDGQHFIEQAARAQLSLLRRTSAGMRSTPPPDALDVSLHDDELADEVELMTQLMIAANGVATRLPQGEIDRALGLPGLSAAPRVPQQRPA